MSIHVHPPRIILAILPLLGLVGAGCEPPAPQPASLPPAYISNQITDPALQKVVEEVRTWASGRLGAGGRPIYGRVEVLPPVPIVQPYGVGVFQEEIRLPVILTTGPGWAGMELPAKEAAVAEVFRYISGRLETLDREPPLHPTLTVQTPQGMELTWINHLDPAGRNVHGDE